MKTIPKSKRFRFAVYSFHVFVLIGVYGVHAEADLSGLAIYMAATAIPLVAYIFGDSFRSSNTTDINK